MQHKKKLILVKLFGRYVAFNFEHNNAETINKTRNIVTLESIETFQMCAIFFTLWNMNVLLPDANTLQRTNKMVLFRFFLHFKIFQ